nr:zinc finger BED domain-containing protein RICESLEEPER 3-like [Tanacetum cinerariifolium]
METQGETSNSKTRIESNEFPPRLVAATAVQYQTKTNDVSNEVEQVGRKRKLTSHCWNHFKKIKVNGEWKADCNYCHKRLAGSSKHGTKHLNDHHKHCLFRPVSDIRQHILVEEKNEGDVYGEFVIRCSRVSARFVVVRYQVLLNKTTDKLVSCVDATRNERRLLYHLLVPEDLTQRYQSLDGLLFFWRKTQHKGKKTLYNNKTT